MAVDVRKRNDRQNRWIKENADRINFMMPKGTKERIKDAAEMVGLSMSEWINRAIEEKLQQIGPGPEDLEAETEKEG